MLTNITVNVSKDVRCARMTAKKLWFSNLFYFRRQNIDVEQVQGYKSCNIYRKARKQTKQLPVSMTSFVMSNNKNVQEVIYKAA